MLKTQYATRTAGHTLAAGEAMIIFNGLTKPDVAPHVNADGAVVRADAALHAANIIWNDPSVGSGLLLDTLSSP